MATAAQAQADRDVEKLAISEPVTPRTSILTDADLDKFTLARRPWRRQITPFRDILAGKYAGEGTPEKPYLVEWLPDDVENPLRYPNKWTLTSFVSISTLAVSLASSAYSGAIESLTKQFHASNEVLVLGVSMFVLGVSKSVAGVPGPPAPVVLKTSLHHFAVRFGPTHLGTALRNPRKETAVHRHLHHVHPLERRRMRITKHRRPHRIPFLRRLLWI